MANECSTPESEKPEIERLGKLIKKAAKAFFKSYRASKSRQGGQQQ